MSAPTPVASSPVASWGDRAGAFLLDLLLLLPLWVVAIVIDESSRSLGDLLGWGLLALWVYGRLLDSVRGQSPAKALLGLRVVDAQTAGRVPLQHALLRWAFGLFFIVLLAPINYVLAPLVSRRHQTLHDMIGSAVVIKDPDSRVRLGIALWAWPATGPLTSPVSQPSAAVGPALRGLTGTAVPSRKGRRAWIVAVAIVALIVADWYVRNRELGYLLDAAEKVEQSWVTAQEGIDSADRYGFRAAMMARNCYSETTDECQQYFDEHWDEFSSAVSAAAAGGAVGVRESGAEVEQVSVLPWHGGLKEARAAYVEYSAAWYRYLRAVADDAAKLRNFSDAAELSSTHAIAEARLRDAVPIWALADVDERIDDIYAE